jgi:imidazolonepropionase-like amidohydrolase
MEIVLADATVLDMVKPEPFQHATIVIENGRIVGVLDSRRTPGPSGDRVIHDLSGLVVMPGLWDAHAHLAIAMPQTDATKRPPLEPSTERAIRAGRNAVDALYGGITAIRVVGEADYVDVAWKRAFDSGLWDGPRLFVCGAALACTGGHATRTALAVECDGPEGFRAAAREQFKRGADQIKLMVTGGIGGSPDELPDEVELTVDEMRAAVEVAHERRRVVGAHVGGAAGAKAAIAVGVDCIEHGYLLDEEAVDLMARKGTYYVPTLSVTQLGADHYASIPWAEYAIRNASRVASLHLRSFQMALEAGCKIASGEDMHSVLPYAHMEIELLVKSGMAPYAALVAATRTPAEICGISNELGTIEAGKIADLVVLPSNPVDNIRSVERPIAVFKAGRRLEVDRGRDPNRGNLSV